MARKPYDKIIKAKLGVEGVGFATIPADSTSVTVEHNYGKTPTIVIAVPTNEYGIDFYISNKNATTFTINIQVPQASDATFDWICR